MTSAAVAASAPGLGTNGSRPTAPFQTYSTSGSQSMSSYEATLRSAVSFPELRAAHRRRFDELVEQWRRDTSPHSVVSRIAMHPAYQSIIGMGERALPFILEELKRTPGHWFWALSAITNESPVPVEARGNMRAMADAWLRWGKARRLI